jgi:hypothetical protein
MVGLIQLADDEGRLEGDPVILRSQLFPAGGIAQAEFERALDFLDAAGEVVLYAVGDAPYAAIPGWRDKNSWQYQQISKRQSSRLPAPPDPDSGSDQNDDETPPGDGPEHSGNVPGTLPEDDGTTPGGSREQGTGSREEDSPPLPSPGGEGGGGEALPQDDQPLTAGEQAAANVVAEALTAGHVRLDPDDEQRGLDRDLTGVERAIDDAKRARDGNALSAAERRRDELRRRRGEAIRERQSAASALLRSGDAASRTILRRWQNADVLVGPEYHRVPLRVACKAARADARADERDMRRGARGRGDSA